MATIQYSLFLGNQPATQDQLDRFEDITVQQEVDMAWEARLQVPLQTDAQGNWTGESEAFLESFQRVRVEVQVGNADWVPLIDGPVASTESQMSGDPSQSILTLIVRDDSVYLHRDERVSNFGTQSITDIALSILTRPPQITQAEVDTVDAAPPGSVVQRGTEMQILRSLARCVGMHAYVLPGDQPGQSAGYFKKFTTRKNGLPDLILTGEERNVGSLRVTNSSTTPGTRRSSTLSLSDRGLVTAQSSFGDLELLGTDPPLENSSDAASRMMSPECVKLSDPDTATRAQMDQDSYSFSADGTVVSDCYTGVLLPYQLVSVGGANGRLSGDYLIKKVTHTLNRNFYGQSFSLMRNARSAGTGGGAGGPAGAIF